MSKPCTSRRTLTPRDSNFVYNLHGTDLRSSVELICLNPGEHVMHVVPVITQYFGQQADTVHWWASWRDHEGPDDDYALFTVPICPEDTDEEWCHLIDSHEGGVHYFE